MRFSDPQPSFLVVRLKMTELRHSRDITRFHRDRIIKKRKNNPAYEFFKDQGKATRQGDGRYVYESQLPDNWLSKHRFADCSCLGCRGPRYIRPRFDWRRALIDQDYAALARRIIQNGW